MLLQVAGAMLKNFIEFLACLGPRLADVAVVVCLKILFASQLDLSRDLRFELNDLDRVDGSVLLKARRFLVFFPDRDPLSRLSFSHALGAILAAVVQCSFCLHDVRRLGI
jgi:hypothetical protein